MDQEQLRAAIAYLDACLNDMHERAGDLPFEAEQQTQWDEGVALREEYRTQLAALEERDRTIQHVLDTAVRTEPATHTRSDRITEDIYDLSSMRSFPGTDEFATEVTDRAMRSIEAWPSDFTPEMRESAEHIARHLDKSLYPGQGAAHILRTGNPYYLSAFKKIVANPQMAAMVLDSDERAAVAEVQRTALSEGSTSVGGALVPPMLDPSIILTNSGTTNQFRGISTVKTIGTQTWKGVTSAGVTAEWLAEAQEVSDASPSFVQPTITPARADAYIQASMEMIQDTDISMEVAMLLADAKDRLESTAFATGSGSSQPFGIVTELQLVTASRVAAQTNASYGAIDVFALDNALGPRWRANASWMANKTTWNLTRQFATGAGAQSSFWVDLGGGRPASLIGYPVYESSAMKSGLSTATASDDDLVVLGDFKQYYIVDRIGLEIVYNPLVLGSSRRPTGEVGWVAFWRVGARTVNADAFRMLRV